MEKLKIYWDIERVETSRMCAMDFKSIYLNRAIAFSFISRLIWQLTMIRARGYLGNLGLLPDKEKKSDIDIIFEITITCFPFLFLQREDERGMWRGRGASLVKIAAEHFAAPIFNCMNLGY